MNVTNVGRNNRTDRTTYSYRRNNSRVNRNSQKKIQVVYDLHSHLDSLSPSIHSCLLEPLHFSTCPFDVCRSLVLYSYCWVNMLLFDFD